MSRTMGKVRAAEQGLLFVGTLYSDSGIFDYSKEIIEKNFGEILLTSPFIKWDYSSYYKDELGWPLFRQFIFFKNLIDPGILADIKLKTNEIEGTLSSKGKRCINLDPGYLTLSKIVLASTKNYAHRIYLGKGIYGEVSLIYKSGIYSPHLFTYRDYQDKTCIDIFMNARELLKGMLHLLQES
jgi:hypothetical protein